MPAVFTEHLGYLMFVVFLRLSEVSWFLVDIGPSLSSVLFSIGIPVFSIVLITAPLAFPSTLRVVTVRLGCTSGRLGCFWSLVPVEMSAL